MTLVDTYRNNVLRKKEEISKLNADLAKEQAKIAPLRKKILSAEDAINRTKNSTTAKSKLNEISRANKSITDIEKKMGDIQKKITQKQKELSSAEKSYRNEEAREQKKILEAEKKRQKEAEMQMKTMVSAINQHTLQQNILSNEIKQLKNLPNKITVLFMAANPVDTSALRLDEEVRTIQEKIRLSEYRDSINFETRWAVRSSDILQAINETNPTIVHFSGHGSKNGDLVLENPNGSHKLVSKEIITAAMATASDTIRLVVFNACFSQSQAENIVTNIDSAIGMSTSIGDKAACVFAAQLYSSIGFGRSLKSSFDQAIVALSLADIPEENTPQLYSKNGIDLNEMFLVSPDNA